MKILCKMKCLPLLFVQDLKLKYYQLMIELDLHEGSYLAVCKHYRAIYNTPKIQDDKLKKEEVRLIL